LINSNSSSMAVPNISIAPGRSIQHDDKLVSISKLDKKARIIHACISF